MIHCVDDSEVLGLNRSDDGIFILMPSMYKSNRRRRDMAQPRCHIGVCRKYCPYKDSPFKVDIVNLMNGKDAVCLLKERSRGEWCSCVVMYLNGKCNVSEKTIEKDVFGFMNQTDLAFYQHYTMVIKSKISTLSSSEPVAKATVEQGKSPKPTA